MRSFGLTEESEHQTHWVSTQEKPNELMMEFYSLARSCTQTLLHNIPAQVHDLDELMEKAARPKFQMQQVADGEPQQNRQHHRRHARRLDDRVDANTDGTQAEHGRQVFFQCLGSTLPSSVPSSTAPQFVNTPIGITILSFFYERSFALHARAGHARPLQVKFYPCRSNSTV